MTARLEQPARPAVLRPDDAANLEGNDATGRSPASTLNVAALADRAEAIVGDPGAAASLLAGVVLELLGRRGAA